jgi:hypothetical protein
MGTEETRAIESAQEQLSCSAMEEHGLRVGKFLFLDRRNEILAGERSNALVRIVAGVREHW